MKLPEQEKRNLVLLAAYKIHTTKTPHIDIDELGEVSGVGREVWQIIRYLGDSGKGWLKKSGSVVRFTVEGLEEAEKMASQRFERKENLVLQKLCDERRSYPHGLNPDELAAALNLDLSDVRDIIVELERKGWAAGGDENTWILPEGIKELEKIAEPPPPHIVIYNPTNSPMSFGPHSSQTVTYNNQNVQDILPDLARLIQDVYALQFDTQADVVAELQKVEALASGEMNPDKWQLIQSRLITAKTALEIGKIAVNTLPYWLTVWNFFFK